VWSAGGRRLLFKQAKYPADLQIIQPIGSSTGYLSEHKISSEGEKEPHPAIS